MRPSAPALSSMRRPSQGTRSAFTRSPSSARTAGSRVSAATTVTMPTSTAPVARLRRIVSGTSTMPTIASTNAEPLNRTARQAVDPTVADRVELLVAEAPLLAEPRDDEQRVVDPEREAHPRDHVDDEDREVERLADERREPERDDDRRRAPRAPARGPRRPRRTRAAGRQRDRQAELELALLGDPPARASRSPRSAVNSPVIAVSKPPPAAASTTRSPAPISASPSPDEAEREDRRVPVGRHEGRVAGRSRTVRTGCTTPVTSIAAASASTFVRNAGSSTVVLRERTTTSSLT